MTAWQWRSMLLGLLVISAAIFNGCARGGEGIEIPESVMDITVDFAGPVDDTAWYYIAFNKNSAFTPRIPQPIVSGPIWGNGWGSGSITHFVQYHLGRYELYAANLSAALRQSGGGVTAVGGTPTGNEAGRYTLTVGTVAGDGTSAPVTGTFVPIGSAPARNVIGTLLADSNNAGNATSPIPGATITCGSLSAGGVFKVDVEISQTPTFIDTPFSYELPNGTSTLSFSLDLADFGSDLSSLAMNIIVKPELSFDPTLTDPDLHCYDALGPLGNDAISFTTSEYRTYENSSAFIPEEANDTTLASTVSATRRKAVDITNWQVTLRRLR